ncbi:hypothetical protein Q6D67_18895 [Haliea sp. E1-2-M8]|uniref:hypothetical protein n=1 Tax=Haliea sp. E1-2-M8 TaxID=3064706 RepID=UPI00271E9CB7|nr:hypothetical protein [Haliea sp. E1-2-M8]MDO8863765.1 hypothetical protein [Haliea sp. E1-2-M8]
METEIMRPTKDYLRKSAFAAAFALAIPLHANADLLPPPSDLEKSLGGFRGIGEYSMVLPASGNLNKTEGGPGSKQSFAASRSARNGFPVNSNTPRFGRPVSKPFLSAKGAGKPFVRGSDNAHSPSFGQDKVGTLTDSLFGNERGSVRNNNQRSDKVNQRLQAWARAKISDQPGDARGGGYFDGGSLDNIDNTQPDWTQPLAVGPTNGGNVGFSNQVGQNVQLVAVPAPGTLMLLGAGLLLLGTMRRPTA